VLMSRVARKVEDKRVLGLIRRYLQAGIMVGGVVSPRTEGTPQFPFCGVRSGASASGTDSFFDNACQHESGKGGWRPLR